VRAGGFVDEGISWAAGIKTRGTGWAAGSAGGGRLLIPALMTSRCIFSAEHEAGRNLDGRLTNGFALLWNQACGVP
jgi:hypothetical protein